MARSVRGFVRETIDLPSKLSRERATIHRENILVEDRTNACRGDIKGEHYIGDYIDRC